ncbi:hypothetical protein [Micromonospora sp. NPDC005806]|uniref:hypothetical protein n=1 Tax=Micromonospora sp. NPDC005806 TaxID=3364234 RepID=UPI0036955EEB
MSSYRDPTLRGDVHPSEEEIDPTGVGLDPDGAPSTHATPPTPAPTPTPEPEPGPPPGPGPAPRAYSIVTRHLDGSTEVVTDLDGDGVADVVHVDLDGDGVPDVTYLDSDHDGRLDTVRHNFDGPAR